MAMAGARFDKVRHDRYCDTHLDRGDCHWAGTVGLGEDPRSVARLERSLEDPRLTAAVSFDLGFTQAFNPASVTAIDIPILVIGAGLSRDRGHQPFHVLCRMQARRRRAGGSSRRGRRDHLRRWRRPRQGGPACRDRGSGQDVPGRGRCWTIRRKLMVVEEEERAFTCSSQRLRIRRLLIRGRRRRPRSPSAARTALPDRPPPSRGRGW